MKRWINRIALVMSVGGGLCGLNESIFRLVGEGDRGGGFFLLIVLTIVFLFGIVGGIRFVESGSIRDDWIRAYLAIQVPIVSSPLVTYKLLCAPRLSIFASPPDFVIWTRLISNDLTIGIDRPDSFGFGLNLIPLALLLALFRLKSAHRRGTESGSRDTANGALGI